jgi:hypothetical protein
VALLSAADGPRRKPGSRGVTATASREQRAWALHEEAVRVRDAMLAAVGLRYARMPGDGACAYWSWMVTHDRLSPLAFEPFREQTGAPALSHFRY